MNKNLTKQIKEFAIVDQKIRKGNFSKSEQVHVQMYIVYLIDAVHNYRIRQLIEKHGYPNKKMIGERGLQDFWLLVQHQDFDIDLQNACLEHCDFGPKEKAYLMDRILVNLGKRQLYGTQFYRNKKGKFIPRPIKDRKNLNKRRREAKLSDFNKYKAVFKNSK